MHREFLDEQRAHPPLLEVAVVHPRIRADDLVRELAVAGELLLAALPQLEHELLDPFVLVHLEEALLQPWALVLHRLAVHVAEHHVEEFPDAIEVATVHAADAELVRIFPRVLLRRELALGHV